ncbi:MAG: cupredoxin domain-containing protein [Nitrospirae bacterium]|nr:cupredoxin domain-containing protein [Nitrospirota bacterium]
MMKRAYILIIASLLIAGCAGVEYVKDAPERVKAADWAKMQIISISMTEHKFTPSELVFKADMPYKLVLKNEGRDMHYFVSEGFFRAIALRKVQSISGEVKAPYLTAVEVYPGHIIELYFIPVRGGNYEFICTIAGHLENGMKGNIRIENSKPASPSPAPSYSTPSY